MKDDHEYRYCPRCAHALEDQFIGGHPRKACACGFVHWGNPVPVVAGLVRHEGEIILARNAQWPVGVFSLITGFLEQDETPAQAALREVQEELGLHGEAADFIGHYPLAAMNQIILAFWVTATGEVRLGEEIAEVRRVSHAMLERWNFGAFAVTAAIVQDGLANSPP